MSDEVLYREVAVREVNTETREVIGMAVPYGETIDVGGYRERFERGDHAFEADAVLYAVHDHLVRGLPIGKVVEWRDTAEGVLVRAHISETEKGNEVYTLLRDGVIKGFSVGFTPIESRMDGDVVVRTKSRFWEVSVTPNAAYKRASVSEVRSEASHTNKEETPMTEQVNTEVTELREALTDLERKIAVMGEQDAPKSPQFRSGGTLLKALARGDEGAKAEFRAADATGPATSAQGGADFGNGGNWISRPLRFVQERRRIINVFSRGPLPAAGNTVEFPKVGSTAGSVGKQATDGAALSYMEVELTTGSATVGTYGGYSSLSRQSIERSDEAYLEAVLRYQAIQYAKATNADARTTLAGIAGQSTPLGASVAHAAAVAKDWIDAVVDAAALIEDNSLGLDAEIVVVSRDVFKSLATLVDGSGRPLFVVNADGQNSLGDVSPVRAQFSIAGLPGFVDPGLAVNTCKVASREAMTTLESPGAPFRLMDESVVNLTKDFSLYGYAAFTVNDANGVVTVDVDGV